MLRLLTPDYRVAKVEMLSLGFTPASGGSTRSSGRRLHLETLSARRRSPEVAAWLAEMRAGAIGLCLVSNGYGRRIGQLAEAPWACLSSPRP